MIYRFLLRFKVWQMIIAALAIIVTGGWVLMKVFGHLTKKLAYLEE